MFTVRQAEEFVAWLDGLGDQRAQIRIIARLRQAEAGNLGDWQPIEGEVSEMRVHYEPGYRLYFVRRGRFIVITRVRHQIPFFLVFDPSALTKSST